jgi:hypothetical protein
MQSNAARKNHNQTFMYEPEEPDSWEPELPAKEPDFKEDPALSESETNESEEVPLEPEEESHGVTVVVAVVASTLNDARGATIGAGAGGDGAGAPPSPGLVIMLSCVSHAPSCKHIARTIARVVFMITASTREHSASR